MRFQGLDLNLLVALDALLAEQNVSLAAERVNLSQSAMSGALARLREYFDDEILRLVGRRMVLTPAAREMVGPVRQALINIETTITKRPKFDPATSNRRFSIIASDYSVAVLLSDVLRRTAKEAPGVIFNIRSPGEDPASRLERGEVDFVLTPESYASDRHPSQLLFEDDYVVVAWSGAKGVPKTICGADYLQLGHVVVNFDHAPLPSFDEQFLRSTDQHRRIEVVAPSFCIVPELLAGTDRISTMHRRLAERYCAIYPLRIMELPFAIPSIRQVIQWHTTSSRDLGVQWVLDQVLGQIEESGHHPAKAPAPAAE